MEEIEIAVTKYSTCSYLYNGICQKQYNIEAGKQLIKMSQEVDNYKNLYEVSRRDFNILYEKLGKIKLLCEQNRCIDAVEILNIINEEQE